MWLDAKQLLVVAVRGRATLRWGCFYSGCVVSPNAVDFEGCVLLFADHGAELVCNGIVREHSSISKVVDTREWYNVDLPEFDLPRWDDNIEKC